MKTKELNLKPQAPKMISVIPPNPKYPTDVIVPPITVNFDDVPIEKEKQYIILSPNSASKYLNRYLRHYNIPYKHYSCFDAIEMLSGIIELPVLYKRPYVITHGCDPGESYEFGSYVYCVVETHFNTKALYQKLQEIKNCDEVEKRFDYEQDVIRRMDNDIYGDDGDKVLNEHREKEKLARANAEAQGLNYDEECRKRYELGGLL